MHVHNYSYNPNNIFVASPGHDETYFTLMRMDRAMFGEILDRIAHRIKRQDTNYRKAITPIERLSLTLQFLATGK